MKSPKNIATYLCDLPHKKALYLALPMIVSNISVPLMSLADTAMLGHLNNARYLGGVTIGANIIAFMFWMLSFLRMGTTSVTGRAYGRKHSSEIMLTLLRGISMAICLGLILIVTQVFSLSAGVSLITSDQHLATIARNYADIRIFSAPAVLLSYVLIGWFIGIQNTRIPMFMIVSSNLLNVLLDYIFIVEWNWGEKGAASATLIAEYVGLFLGLYFVFRELRVSSLMRVKYTEIFKIEKWQQLLSLHLNLFIRTAVLLFTFNFFTAQSAAFGEATLAANAILMQLILLVSFCLDGYAHAAETMIAEAVGGKKIQSFFQAVGATTLSAFVIAALLTLFFWSVGTKIFLLFTDLQEVLSILATLDVWLYILPLVSIWCYLLDGIFIGGGKTACLRNLMIVAVLGFFLPIWHLTQYWGNQGLWFSFVAFNAFRGASLAVAFYSISKKANWV